MTKEKAKEIVKNLEQTLSRMSKTDGIRPDNPMFKLPRPKRSDLLRKKNELINQYKL